MPPSRAATRGSAQGSAVPRARRSTQPSSARRGAPVVHKFGGAALEDARAVVRAASLVARQLADEPGPAVEAARALGVTLLPVRWAPTGVSPC